MILFCFVNFCNFFPFSLTSYNTMTLFSIRPIIQQDQSTLQLRFGVHGMETYYYHLKNKHTLMIPAILDIVSFREDFPNIFIQMKEQDWYNILAPRNQYMPNIVWEFYGSYHSQMDRQVQPNSDVNLAISTVLIRGKEVHVTPIALHTF